MRREFRRLRVASNDSSFRRAREGELPRRGKRSWPGPRPGAPRPVDWSRRGISPLRRRATFSAMRKSPKNRRGTAQDERFALIFAFPPDPRYGGALLIVCAALPARKTRSAWSKFPPPHWGLSLLNLEGFAVQDPRLGFRTNAPGPVFVVGATLTVARKAFPGGRLFKVHALYL